MYILQPKTNSPKSVSVIIPTLNEESRIGGMLERLIARAAGREVELIVVDGGSCDNTVEIVRRFGEVRLVELDRPGRGFQMNRGAEVSHGEVLLFLHADVTIPDDLLEAIDAALSDERVRGGCFQLGFPPDAPRSLALVAWGINLRTRLFITATGDQGIFLLRDVFDQIGGYRNIPLMEDVELFLAIKRIGRAVVLDQRIEISPRRWMQHGTLRTVLLMYALRAGYWIGISPTTLKRLFVDVR